MWQQYFDNLFPVRIDAGQDVLVVEDRRPSDGLLLSVVLTAGSLFVSALLFRSSIDSRIYWPLILFLLPAPVFGVRSLLLPFREKYVFDRGRGTYAFTRQSVLKKETTEGDAGQIRAVQLERRAVTTEHGTREIYRVALRLRHGLLLGASDTLVLREETPVGSRFESEARIAYAIADFLRVPVPETVNV
ncbi:MAG: hypothetical protein ACRD68_06560 [Pyrinomonadaceae bacterium]